MESIARTGGGWRILVRMASETSQPAGEPSAWSKLPEEKPAEAPPPAADGKKPSTERLRAAAAQVASATAQAASRISEGVKKASAAFDAPQGAQLEEMLRGADLPSLAGED